MTKTCTKCGKTKPVTEFNKNATGRAGLRSGCKTCVKANKAAYYLVNCEKIKEASTAWGVDNPEKKKANADAYRAANPEKNKAYHAAYRASNPEKHKASSDKWRAANPDKCKASRAAYLAIAANREKSKAYADSNREKNKVYADAYRAANREKSAAAAANWRAANPETCCIYHQNRRARKNGGKLSSGLSVKLLKLQRGKCACCGESLGANYHLDHIMPLALGGTNTDDNIQLLRASCNLQKNAKHPVDFMQGKGFLL